MPPVKIRPPRPAQRLVSHHEGPTFLRPCATNLPADTYLAAGGKRDHRLTLNQARRRASGSPAEGIEARRPVPGSLAVQRSVHDLASLQYQRMSAQACPPSGTIRLSGSSMPHSEHWAGCDGRGWSLRCRAIGAPRAREMLAHQNSATSSGAPAGRTAISDGAYAVMVPPGEQNHQCLRCCADSPAVKVIAQDWITQANR